MIPPTDSKDPEQEAAELLGKIGNGDADALAEIYDRFCGALFSIIIAVTHNHSDAEEVMQKTFTKIWAKASTYDRSKGKAATWIITVAKRTALDHIRGLKRRENTLSSAANDPSAATWVTNGSGSVSAGQAASLISNEDSERVREAIAKLPDEQRRVIELSYFQSMSQAEISRELDVPLGTIKSRIRRAMHTLRVTLSDLL